MTATLPRTMPDPAVIDPLGGATPTEHAEALTSLCLALLSDAERFGLRPVDLNLHREHGHTSAALMFGGADTAAVDALAGAYGLAPATPGGGLYGRAGNVTVDGQPVRVLLYCSRPGPARPPVPAKRSRGTGTEATA